MVTERPDPSYYNVEPCGDPACHVLITHTYEESLLTVDALPNTEPFVGESFFIRIEYIEFGMVN